jgi:predicted GIY-YIG superfamily endonuclease
LNGPRTNQTTALYRFYDATNALLYIGITNNLTRRIDEHDEDKPWYQHVARVTVEHHPSRGAALDAEKAAIKAEKPRHNVVHNRRPGGTHAKSTATGRWAFTARRTRQEWQTDLQLYPELDCSAMVDDYWELDGEGQFEEYVRYIQRRYAQWWDTDAVPIVWAVHNSWGQVFESAPYTEERPWGDFLTHFTWPIDAVTGERLDWFKLPVINDRFPEFSKALDWTPSPLQPTCPLRSIVQSRSGYRPLPAARGYPTAA